MAGWADRALAAVGLQRRRARQGRSVFAGAANNRLTADWVLAPVISANQEVAGSLRVLRERSRDLVRNTGYVTGFVGTVSDNVIGPQGIRLQAKVKTAADEFDATVNDELERAWGEWAADPASVSADGRLSWVDLQALAMEAVATDGEVLIRMLRGFDNPHGFALQLLDADLLDETYNVPAGSGTNAVHMGVEVDRWGRAVAYHLWTQHPGETGQRTRERWPADEIIHLGLPRRIGQVRYLPWFAPVLMPAKMLSAFEEAAVVAARVSAANQAVFFAQDAEAVEDPDALGDAAVPVEADPGTYSLLPPGVTPHFYDPAYPNTSVGDFNKAIMRGIAAALRVSYNTLARDLEAVNYSSLRAGTLAERDVWRRLQGWLATHLHTRVYREWVRWALLSGALELPTLDATRYTRHGRFAWLPRGWQWVDPAKDLKAARDALELKLASRTQLAAEAGRDFEEVLADHDYEQQLAAAYGVELDTPSAPGEGAHDDGDDDEDEAEGKAGAAGRTTGALPHVRDRARAPVVRLLRRAG